MALPNIFGTTPQNTQRPGADLDTNFNAIGATGIIPCVTVGTNALTLTPFANNITIAAYTNFLAFAWNAAATSTGPVTVQIGALAPLPLYRPGGVIQCTTNDIVANVFYVIAFQQSLNGNAGGFAFVSPPPLGPVLIATQTVSVAAAVNFTSGLDGTYDEYLFVISNLVPVTNATDLYLQVSTDGGATYKAGGTDYRWGSNSVSSAATNTPQGAATDTKLSISSAGGVLPNVAADPQGGEVRIFNPSLAVIHPVIWTLGGIQTSGAYVTTTGGGGYLSPSVVNALRFIMSSGNISTATISMYGIRK